jgi:hypothetical protein
MNMCPISNENLVLAKAEMSVPAAAIMQYCLAVNYNSFLLRASVYREGWNCSGNKRGNRSHCSLVANPITTAMALCLRHNQDI